MSRRNADDPILPDPLEPRPSRTELTRAAALVTQLGLRLTRLSSADLDRLNLPERLREAIAVNQKIKARSRGRQNRLIGQLLRAEDHPQIQMDLDRLRGGQRDTVQMEKVNEVWVLRIVEEGDPAIEILIGDHPQADRQRLRLLARTARQDPSATKAKRARRELLRAIRALRS
jgi:ribosome-associated protein